MSQQQQNDDYSGLWLTPRGLELLLRCKRAKEVKIAEAPVDPDDSPDPDDSIERLTVSVAATVPESEVQPEESKPEPPLLREIKLAIQESRQRADEEARIRRIKVLPFGGTIVLSDLGPEINQLKGTIAWARQVKEMERDDEANELWASVYGELTADTPGRFGAAIGRAEAQVLRLSMIYALLDKSQKIKAAHLEAALALWKYCENSARYLFLGSFDNPHSAAILKALRRRSEGMTRTEINTQVFQGHLSKTKMSEALNYLRRINLAYSSVEQTPGRSSERWVIRVGNKETEEFD